MSKPKLALIPSGYKSGKVYSILPNDATGDFDYERNGNASRVRKDGLIEELTVDDTPRLDWLNSNCPSLLLEPQRTNYATNNTSMNTYNIVGGSNPSPTLTANYTIAPDGTLTATRLQTSVTGTNYSLIGFPTTASDGSGGGYYTASVYVKSNTGSSQEIAFYGQSSSPTNRTATTEWSRIQFTGQRLANTKYAYLGTINATDDDIDISVWGAQIELVDSYPSSLIYTGASTETRLKDECLNGGDSDLFNITEGTFFVDANNFGTPLNGYNMITISDGTGSNYIRFIYESSRIRVSVLGLGDYFITSVNDNQRNKTLVTFKENEMKVFLNGSLVHTDTLGVLPTDMDRLNFASQSGTSRHFEGKVYDTRFYDRVLTEAEAIELTTL